MVLYDGAVSPITAAGFALMGTKRKLRKRKRKSWDSTEEGSRIDVLLKDFEARPQNRD